MTKPSDADFQRLVSQHHDCSDIIKEAFQHAHREEIASIMQPPPHPHRAFDWIWHPSSNDSDWKPFVDNYWKAISSIPGKARYNGYTMAVIGRMPRRWIDLHLRLMKMMMMLRIMPEKTKIQARVPIPKPKPGETRPLSLIHDDMCFILGFLTKHFTLKCEEINLFPPSLRAYRQGMGTPFITLVDLATREDALSFGRYMALTAEDEEKFFDRVSLEVQLAVLFILGFPMEGLLEMKAEEMDNITVEIHTRHGQVIGKFLHGLKQGSPLSVLISNTTLVFKHRVWSLRDPLATAADPNGYSMSVWNKSIDGTAPPVVSMEGFCDDNSKWNMGNGRDFASVVSAIQWNLKLTGDLSMIFKIGRRGDKTIIELFNVDLDDIHLLPQQGFTSIAWDFKANRPTEEEVDCRVYLKGGQTLPTDKPTSISSPVWKMLLKGTSLKSERSLGIWRNKFGDTSESADKRAFLLGAKIDRLNLGSLKNDKTIKIAVNSLIVPVYQFGILENKCRSDVYDKMDIVIINKVRKALGFAWCDAKQLLFVSEDNFGMGIRSVSVEMLKSIYRELEIQLNDEDLIGKILRGRLEAFKHASYHNAGRATLTSYDDITKGIRNFLMEAIRHVAHYGFYIRDMTDINATYLVEAAITLAQKGSLFKTFQHNTLGLHDFAGTGSRSGTTLGLGDGKLLWSTIYGRCHTLLTGQATPSNVKVNFSSEQLQTIKEKAVEILQDDLQALYTVFEWSDNCIGSLHTAIISDAAHLAHYEQSLNNIANWRRLSALSRLRNSSNDDITSDDDNLCFLDGLSNHTRIDLLNRIDAQFIQPNRLTSMDTETLLTDGWPLIVATDGGADHSMTCNQNSPQANASASVVIFHPPNVPFTQYMQASEDEQARILNNNLLPWRTRASPLPPTIGDCTTDNAHAECFALILMEEWLPHNTPILLLMDSEAERDRYNNLRNMQQSSNRFLIRSLLAGVSKCLGSRLAYAISHYQSAAENLSTPVPSNIFDFCLHAKNWCFKKNGEQSLWTAQQWAPGQYRTVWAIRSHQLESNFSISPKNRYGLQLVPNRAFVSANQWADNVCNVIMRFQRRAMSSQESSEIRKWCPPAIKLGLTGPSFVITLNGVCIDRCVSTAVDNACNAEFIRRFAQKPTQGLFIRLHNEVFLKPEMIGRQSYHRRLLEGKTKTHTRAMYTDAEYRKAIVRNYAQSENWSENTNALQQALKTATKSYKFLRCPFCVTKITHSDTTHIFATHGTVNSGLLGNSRHFGYYCLNDRVTAVRQHMTQLLEDHLTILLKIASKWGRQGFSTLLDRVISALVSLDRSSFHNVHLNDPKFVKRLDCSYACLSADDWISFFESQNTQTELYGKKLFCQWPLVHQFGFVAANSYALLEMQDGEYSPCDIIPLGVIPIVLQDVILHFANELGARHSQEAKKEFKLQWEQVRAAALLRAISIAMVTGAQISEHKSVLLKESLPQPPQDVSEPPERIADLNVKNINNNNTIQHKRRLHKSTDETTTEQFPCIGITCSSLFTQTTNLRSSFMQHRGGTCRRCLNLNNAINCAKAIERTLAGNSESFRSFYNAIRVLDTVTIDDIIAAISKINPVPDILPTSYLKRSTKRNVFPTVMVNTVRFLIGTFKWDMTCKPTSLDIVFNQICTPSDNSTHHKPCQCLKDHMFFTTDHMASCSICAGSSRFTCTETRIALAQARFEKMKALPSNVEVHTHMANAIAGSSKSAKKRYKSRVSAANTDSTNNILRDITNLPPRSPLCMRARPTDDELNTITQPNNMLSNFVVSYFFKLLAIQFNNILYEEFLFDLVKSEGNWARFVDTHRRSTHYNNFFNNLSNRKLICIIPICYQSHWTVLVRRFSGVSWKIFFLDSIMQNSDQRFRDWKELFADDNFFSGSWIKVKVLRQSELECGARVCLNGLCFATSQKKAGDIINDLSRFKDLHIRSRAMVSTICKDGFWSPQQWLRRTIGEHQNAIH